MKETLKQNLGWNSLMGLGPFFMGVGIAVWRFNYHSPDPNKAVRNSNT